jgi:hypothetical protein
METRNNHTPRAAVPTFLALPIEIRYEIYNLALTTPLLRLQAKAREREAAAASLCLPGHTCGAKAKSKSFVNLTECFTSLLRVCHQIYDEAFPFFYKHVTLSIAKPLAFANGFLLRLGSTKISQLKKIEFDIGPLASAQFSAVEGLNSFKFNHILMVFECYPELRNLDMVRMKVAGRAFGSHARDCCRVVTEVTPEQVLSSTSTTDADNIWDSENTKALSRTTLKLVNGSLRGFRIFRELAYVSTARSQWSKEKIYSITLRKARHTA